MAGLVHDVGKINIPTEILISPEPWRGGVRPDRDPPRGGVRYEEHRASWRLAEMICSTTRMTARGTPGLKDQVMLEARVLAVADVVEAMSSTVPTGPPV